MSDCTSDNLREREWEVLLTRYRSHGDFVRATQGDEAADCLIDRVWDSFDEGSAAPLLFEECDDRLRMLSELLDACDVEERSWLKRFPSHLGTRCEASLAGVPIEWFIEHGTLSGADRQRLGQLAIETLLGHITIDTTA